MAQPQAFQRLTIRLCGPIAREILADPGDVHVTAIDGRTIFLVCPSGVIAVGPPDLVAGPFHIATSDDSAWSRLHLAVDDEGRCADGLLSLGDAFTLEASGGVTWQPASPPPFSAEIVAPNLAALRSRASEMPPHGGPAGLIFPPASEARATGTAAAAARSLGHLRRSLPTVVRDLRWTADVLRAAMLLIGLGDGLLPAGDGILSGLLLALSAAGEPTLCDQLWHGLQHELDALTNPVSAMHLSAAADGLASEPLLTLLHSLMQPDAIPDGTLSERFSALSSAHGWDVAAGMLLGFDAVLAAAS